MRKQISQIMRIILYIYCLKGNFALKYKKRPLAYRYTKSLVIIQIDLASTGHLSCRLDDAAHHSDTGWWTTPFWHFYCSTNHGACQGFIYRFVALHKNRGGICVICIKTLFPWWCLANIAPLDLQNFSAVWSTIICKKTKRELGKSNLILSLCKYLIIWYIGAINRI